MRSLVRCVRYTKFLVVATAILGMPMARMVQAQDGKSAEEILKGLLGDERGIKGLTQERRPGEEQQARVAVPIQFRYNSAEITPESSDQLRQVAQALKDPQLISAGIRVEGYTDDIGSASYNQWLSERRAEAVKRYLVEKEGVAAARLEAKGYGKSRPLPGVSQDTEEGRAQNRRVELVNLGSGKATATGARQEPKAAAPNLSVDVVVSYQKGGERRVLAAGGVLTPNDNYRITFTPTRDSYVYVYQIDSKGKADAVFPNTQYSALSNPMKGKQRYSVPPEGQWLTLDERPGEEEIVVLASETELADAEATAKRMRGPRFDTTKRGPASDTRADVAPEPPPGVFSYRLPFKHR